MNAMKKSGIRLIIIGICLPLVALPFMSSDAKGKGFWENFYRIGIQLKKGNESGMQSPSDEITKTENIKFDTSNLTKMVPKRIPLRFFLVAGLILFYLGLVRIIRSKEPPLRTLAEVQAEERDKPDQS
jgi:hypothetical protein